MYLWYFHPALCAQDETIDNGTSTAISSGPAQGGLASGRATTKAFPSHLETKVPGEPGVAKFALHRPTTFTTPRDGILGLRAAVRGQKARPVSVTRAAAFAEKVAGKPEFAGIRFRLPRSLDPQKDDSFWFVDADTGGLNVDGRWLVELDSSDCLVASVSNTG